MLFKVMLDGLWHVKPQEVKAFHVNYPQIEIITIIHAETWKALNKNILLSSQDTLEDCDEKCLSWHWRIRWCILN